MANRFYTNNSQRKVDSTAARSTVSLGGVPTPKFRGADDPPYNANIGPGGPDLNRGVNFPRVRNSMKSKMSPFQGGGGVLTPQQGDMAAGGAGSPLTPTQPIGPDQMDQSQMPAPRRRGLL